MKYYLKKIRSRYKEGLLLKRILIRVVPILIRLKYLIFIFYDPYSYKIKIINTKYKKPNQSVEEIEIIRRIFNSYKAMKKNQKFADKIYKPSSLWQDDLDYGYSYLSESIKTNDLNHFHFFLSNFGNWKRPTGIEYNSLIKNNSKTRIGKSYLRNAVFGNQLKIWKWFYNNNKKLDSLNMINNGNLQGASIEGNFVVPGSFWNEIYGSTLNNLISDKKRPIIADLGAGYGKLAYYLIKDLKESVFVDIDLPETICLAAYYLMTTFPEKKVFLYGEDDFNKNIIEKYDLIFLPSYEITKLENDSVDLFINRNSLGEMSGDTAHHLIKIISEKTNKYFFHMNHNNLRNKYVNSDNGLLASEYDIDKNIFKLIIKYPDLGHLTYRGGLDFNEDIFLHLYEKINI